MKRIKMVVLGITLFSALSVCAAGTFRAGAAKGNITPELGGKIVGGFSPFPSTHVHDDYDRHSHAIEWGSDSGFARLYPGVTSGRVVSIHHQSIKALGRGLRVEAASAQDGVIEAVRLEGKPFVLGVQWHPEFHPPGAPDLLDCTPILDEFLNAARGRRW